MPTRKALLVCSANIPEFGKLPGAAADLNTFNAFLTSNAGGAWDYSEIKILVDPSVNILKQSIQSLASADYAFITFSGHGEHLVGKGLNETRLYLSAKETLLVRELNPGCKRQTILIDSCRALTRVDESILEKRSQLQAFSAANIADPIRAKFRAHFDSAMMAAEEGRIVMYSCGVGQSAGETNRGGFFSRSIVEISEEYCGSQGYFSGGSLSVREAFEKAKEKTCILNAPQSPEIESGRRMRFFPFAIR
jgi:Caspase domain